MKSLKTLKFGNVCFVRPDLQFESSYSYCSKHILIQLKKKISLQHSVCFYYLCSREYEEMFQSANAK